MSSLEKRIYYAIELSLVTPLCVSNGIEEMTDCDVIRNWDGEPFIPGTSFMGAFRNFYEDVKKNTEISIEEIFRNSDKNTGISIEEIFGDSDEDTGKMSQIWISDFYFDDEVSIVTRDGVQLENKVSVPEAKYDYEVIEYGKGTLFMQLLVWDEKKEEELQRAMHVIMMGIQSGDIRLGAQKNRGLGRLKIEKIYSKKFSKSNLKEWIDFTKESIKKEENKSNLSDYKEKFVSYYTTIKIPLRLTGGLSIRQYSTKVNQPDFVSLQRKMSKNQEDEKVVISGSSWKGAIRSRMTEILEEILEEMEGKKELKKKLKNSCEEIFGYVKKVEKKAKASDMAVMESKLEKNTYIRSTRNQVSRFENATVDGALYEERCAVGGETELEIKIRNDKGKSDWFIGLLILAIKDIQNGYLSIGGGTAIGRGIFESNGKIIILNGKTEKEYYIEKLREKIQEQSGGEME
ncbi:MAG: RAMP superfamily CRISPR-associated protein [Lachnospiraceae bacterium]